MPLSPFYTARVLCCCRSTPYHSFTKIAYNGSIQHDILERSSYAADLDGSCERVWVQGSLESVHTMSFPRNRWSGLSIRNRLLLYDQTIRPLSRFAHSHPDIIKTERTCRLEVSFSPTRTDNEMRDLIQNLYGASNSLVRRYGRHLHRPKNVTSGLVKPKATEHNSRAVESKGVANSTQLPATKANRVTIYYSQQHNMY